jgi:hypothetical protein
MDKNILDLLKGFDQLVSDISTMEMKIREGNEPYREATPADRLDYLRAEWFGLVENINELGIDITED